MYLRGTNFRGCLISLVENNRISRMSSLIFFRGYLISRMRAVNFFRISTPKGSQCFKVYIGLSKYELAKKGSNISESILSCLVSYIKVTKLTDTA